ncbi:hypothetical protein RD792_006003 [Penstemon davidsonii]|uniref:Cytochrome P450 n=1 Tax=Penstemon davidsonii TaxID=160366 RepID=A0ABR0DDR5_9LAMI|nr:hypothetical protein RD792_006003 [Penstemon davidsonii]
MGNILFSMDLFEFGPDENHSPGAQLKELLLAGTDTTNIIIIWALSDLIKNKNEMYKVRVELQTNIGDRILEESDIMVLPYLQACVEETIRMHPPIPFLLPHRATETCNVMNFTIPKGSQVMVNTWAMANDPSIWDDPSSYRPERFLDSGVDFKGNNFEFVPFGSGRRMCPGLPMAFVQVQYVVACLVNTFNWFDPRDNDFDELDMEEVYHLAMRKKNPLELIPRAVNQWIEIMKIAE